MNEVSYFSLSSVAGSVDVDYGVACQTSGRPDEKYVLPREDSDETAVDHTFALRKASTQVGTQAVDFLERFVAHRITPHC